MLFYEVETCQIRTHVRKLRLTPEQSPGKYNRDDLNSSTCARLVRVR